MKKESLVVVFYILYFSWLFTVTYLTPDATSLSYFTVVVALFYFIFLREKGDIFWFWLGALIPVVFASISFMNWTLKFDISFISFIPLWLPIAWGTTFVALRKFYIILNK